MVSDKVSPHHQWFSNIMAYRMIKKEAKNEGSIAKLNRKACASASRHRLSGIGHCFRINFFVEPVA
jgi:hypothetical protein